MAEEITAKKMFINSQGGKGSIGKPRKKWLDEVENDLKKVCLRGCRRIARDRDTRNLILKEARDLHGPYSQ